MRILTIVVAASALTASMSASVRAGEENGNPNRSAGGSAYDGVISAGVQFGAPPSGVGNGRDASGCVWNVPWAGERYDEPSKQATTERDGISYRLWFRTCPSGTTRVWARDGASSGDLGLVAAERVTRLLPAPRLATAPPITQGVVNVGMWFWIDSEMWAPVSATAWIPTPGGIVWATATASPVRLVYDPGDGDLGAGPIACPGPGAAWTPSDGDEATSTCSYTYRHASVMDARGLFTATIAVDWEISWQSNLSAGGTLPSHTTRSIYDVEVRDIQAIVDG